MPNNDEMTIDERYKYLRIRQKTYGKAGRLERTGMLDEMEQVTGLVQILQWITFSGLWMDPSN